MKIQNEKTNDQLYEVSIEIEPADYAENVDKQLKKRRREASVPGFRQGNAPMAMIKKMYEGEIVANELLRAVDPAIDGYIKEQNWNVLGFPVEVPEKTKVDFTGKTTSVFVFEIGLEPEFDLNYDQIPAVKRFKITASEKEIDDAKMQIRKRHGSYEKQTEILDGDFVHLKVNDAHTAFFMTGDLTEEGRKLFINNKLQGKLDIDLKAVFLNERMWARALHVKPEELNDATNYNVSVEITEIERNVPAELNEEFFKNAFPKGDVTNEAELTAFAANEVEKTWGDESKRHFANEIVDTLLKNVTISLPDDAFLKRLLMRNNSTLTEEKVNTDFDRLKDGVKWELISTKVIEAEKIAVSADEIRQYIRNYFVTSYYANLDEEMISTHLDEMVNKQMQDKNVLRAIHDELMSTKLTDTFAAKMKIEDKTCTFQEFLDEITGKATAQPKAKASKAKKEDAAGEVAEKPAKKTTKKSAKADDAKAE